MCKKMLRTKDSQENLATWWDYMAPVISATREAEARESLEQG